MGILVREMMIFLAEAQSVWTKNIIPRTFSYLAETFNRYLQDTNQNVSGTKKVSLPRPELYVICTEDKDVIDKELSFRKEFFSGEDCAIELKIKVITLKNAGKIVKEYIKFAKILDKNNKEYGYTKKSITQTIDYCIKNKILKDYLIENKKEVYNIMTSIYDQKTATEMYGREQFIEGVQQGMQQGIQQGIQQGEIEAFIKIYKKGMIKANEAARMLNISVEQFLKQVK